jgi:hypothetical protein
VVRTLLASPKLIITGQILRLAIEKRTFCFYVFAAGVGVKLRFSGISRIECSKLVGSNIFILKIATEMFAQT